MLLSNRLTFYLIFSVLLVVGFAFVPTVMAAEDGPTIVNIELDDTQTTGTDGVDDDAETTDDNVPAKNTVSNGNALLTKAGQFEGTPDVARADIIDVAVDGRPGTFRLIVTFDRDVYAKISAKPDENGIDRGPTRELGNDDLDTSDITIVGTAAIVGGAVLPGVTVTGVTRVVKTEDDPDTFNEDETEYHPRKFLVTIQVPSGLYLNLPINIALMVNEDVVYGIGTNQVAIPFTLPIDGIGNVESDQYDFQVIARPISAVTSARTPTGIITSFDTLKLTLTFNPALNAADVPTRQNVLVANGEILEDDETTDVDEGVKDASSENAPLTKWVITIIPAGGSGVNPDDITVKSAPGTAFNLNMTIRVDNTPADPEIDPPIITEPGAPTITATDPPTGGGDFVVTLTYPRDTPAPTGGDVPTADDVTITIDPEDSGVVATKGTIGGNGRRYTLPIETTNVPVGTNVTVTIAFPGSTSITKTIQGAARLYPDAPAVETPVVGTELGTREFLVVTHHTVATKTGDDVSTAALPDDTLAVSLAMAASDRVGMPDLEDLLITGGTIDVFVANKGTETTPDYPDVVVNEVMWALDDNAVGTAAHTAHQWIELYNNSDTALNSDDITLRFVRGPSDPSTSDLDHDGRDNTGARRHTDRLSNVLKYDLLRTGWSISGKGKNGNSNPNSLEEFISVSRRSNKLGGNEGINPGNWFQSTLLSHVNHKGTPGKDNTRPINTEDIEVRPGLYPDGSLNEDVIDANIKFTPPRSNVIINEVHNASDDKYDWLELRFLNSVNIRNWTLSYAKSDFTEVEIMRFPNSNRTIAAGTILLIVNADPLDTELATGQDIELGEANQVRGAGPHKYWNPSNGNSSSNSYLDIPDYNGGDFLLILRQATGFNNVNGGWQRINGSRDRLHDVIGTGTFERKTLLLTVVREPNTLFLKPIGDNKGYIWHTRVWPLNGHHDIKNSVAGKAGSLLQNDRKLAVGTVFARNGTQQGWLRDGIYAPGNRGGLGYDRGAVGNGTPGYDNGVVKKKYTDLTNGRVVVSELMLTTDNGRYPQWIELHNTSKTNTVDLHADTDGTASQ